MICQKCKKREASVHFTQNLNGVFSEKYLCAQCAELENIGFSGDFGGLYGFMGEAKKQSALDELYGNLFAGNGYSRSSASREKSCPLCGATVRDINAAGKLGCAKCYEFFAEELRRTLHGIHGSHRHVGRNPSESVQDSERAEREARIEALRGEQAKAIEEQDFELAAKLRDEIKALQAAGEEKKAGNNISPEKTPSPSEKKTRKKKKESEGEKGSDGERS